MFQVLGRARSQLHFNGKGSKALGNSRLTLGSVCGAYS